jgi:molybdate transport system ATP-binding protein
VIELDFKKKLLGAKGEFELNIDLSIKNGEFVALSGKSGSGKTTILRVLAGLESADGRVVVDGNYWLNQKHSLPPQKRKVGFLFQNYALFENMTVLENLLFVSKNRALAKKLLKMSELEDLSSRYPDSLSGGQKQRVALCRAVMREPDILLLDEPFSAVDRELGRRLQEEIKDIHREFEMTTVVVTHSQREIFYLADRILLLEDGKIVSDRERDEILESDSKNKIQIEILYISEGYIFGYLDGEIIKLSQKGRENLQVGDLVVVEIS